MNNSIFNNAISAEACAEIESITHYIEDQLNSWSRITDYVGYVLGGIIVATPMIFGIVANVSGMV